MWIGQPDFHHLVIHCQEATLKSFPWRNEEGYVKSVKQGDQEVSPWDLEIGSSAVQLKVVVGTKYARVEAGLLAPAAGSGPISAILWPASGDPGFRQNFEMISQRPNTINVPPGRYHA